MNGEEAKQREHKLLLHVRISFRWKVDLIFSNSSFLIQVVGGVVVVTRDAIGVCCSDQMPTMKR